MARLGRTGLAQAVCVLVGISMTFLLPGSADGGSGPRTTDIMNAAAAILLFCVVVRGGSLHPAIRFVSLVWLLSFGWIFVEVYSLSDQSDGPIQRVLIRWMMAGCSAYWIAVLMGDARHRYPVVLGQLIGVALSLATVALDWLTFSPEDMPLDQLVNLAIYNGKDIHDFIYRASGIFGHPNGAAGCVLVGVPILIGMIEEKKLPRYAMVAAIILMAATFYMTKSRGPLITSAGLILFWLCTAIKRPLTILVLLGTAAAACLLGLSAGGYVTSQNPILQRFFDTDSIAVNADDRWWTIETAFNLILSHPFGMASSYVDPLNIATGTTATHNAYLELAIMGGIPLALFVSVRLLRTALQLVKAPRPIEAWLAAYLVSIFGFEAYFLQVNMPVLTIWLASGPVARAVRAVPIRRPQPPAAGASTTAIHQPQRGAI